MWLIFVVVGIVIAIVFSLIGFMLVWFWNKTRIRIERDNKNFDIESELYQKIKDEIKKEIREEKENQEWEK